MNNTKIKVIQTYGIWVLDMGCILLAFHLARHLRYGPIRPGRHAPVDRLLIILMLFCVAYNFFLDWNGDFLTRGYLRELQAVLKFNLIMLVSLIIYVYLSHSFPYASRLVFGRCAVFNTAFMFCVHIAAKAILRNILKAEAFARKVFVIAQDNVMEDTIDRIRRTAGVDTMIVGGAYSRKQPASGQAETVRGIHILPGIEGITEAVLQMPIDEVFINTPDSTQSGMRPVISGFGEMGVSCHYSLELPDAGAVMCRTGNLGTYSVITYHKTYMSAKKLLVKRVMDILGGLVGLLITGLLTLVIGPAIKLDSPGPVFFSQVRVGKNGRRFHIYKYRSMYQDAEERLGSLMKDNEMNGLMFKMENDPRITKVGRFLRKTSLDEFPQFFNVLKGDMSLVGTRPPTESEFEQYNEHYRRRISMTPGLTGMWQVSGRSDITDFEEVVKLDLEYIDHWSLMLDLKILLQTVLVIFSHKGAK